MKKLFGIILLFITNSVAAQSLQHVTIILDWFLNPDHAPLFVAEQQGYFKQQGLDVSIVTPANPNDGPKLVAAGKADITIEYPISLLQQVAEGLPLVRVGALFPENLNAVAVLKSSSIKTLQDLKGKTVAMSAGDADKAILSAMLKQVGVNPNDVSFINVNYNLVQALLSHRVDAVTGIMRNVEPIEMAIAGQPARLFYPEDYGVPPSDSAIWVVSRNEVSKTWVNKFLKAIEEGTLYLQKHPEAMWKAFSKTHPELNTEFNYRSWMVTYPLFSKNPGGYNARQYENYAKFLKAQGLIKTVPPLKLYVA